MDPENSSKMKCRREILMKKRIDLNVAYNNGADEYSSIVTTRPFSLPTRRNFG